jgi:hypothetical protein
MPRDAERRERRFLPRFWGPNQMLEASLPDKPGQ